MCRKVLEKEGVVDESKKSKCTRKSGEGYDAECNGNFAETAYPDRRAEEKSGGASLGPTGGI